MIDDILNALTKDGDGNVMLARPASLKDLENVQKRLREMGMPPLPKGYIDFLAKHNGYAFDGEEFFGTKKKPERGTDFVLNDIISANEEFIKRNKDSINDVNSYVFLGDGSESLYVYNTKNQRYEILDFTDRCEYGSFETFDALFAELVSEWV